MKWGEKKKIGVRSLHGTFLLILLLIITSFSGCSMLPFGLGSGTKEIKFIIDSEASSNSGQPFYLVIRAVNPEVFVTEGYQQVADMVFAGKNKAEILTAQVIIPGSRVKVEVPMPLSTPVGVYCLFTKPGDQWKLLLPQPLESKYKLHLVDNRILTDD